VGSHGGEDLPNSTTRKLTVVRDRCAVTYYNKIRIRNKKLPNNCILETKHFTNVKNKVLLG